jgi:hypothetical protein
MIRGGKDKGWTTLQALSSLFYYFFEYEVWRLFKSRIEAKEFDLVHRITPLSPTHQSLIAKPLAQRQIPSVVGPLMGVCHGRATSEIGNMPRMSGSRTYEARIASCLAIAPHAATAQRSLRAPNTR